MNTQDASARDSLSSDFFADTTLLRSDLSGRVHPAVALSWETRDQRTWTFTLRDGLRMQNGEPFTSSRIRDLLNVALSLPLYRPAWRDVEGIDAPTPTTLVIRLARPNNALLEVLSIVRLAGEGRQRDWFAGPFRLVAETTEERTYAPFAGTWTGPPSVAGLRVRFFPSPRAAWAAFLRDEADMFYDVPPDALPLLAENADVQLFDTGPRYVFTIGFQQRHSLLRDPRVRQALNLAIDREAIVRRFFGTYGKAGDGPFSSAYWAAQGAGTAWRYDPAAARALLKEATGGRTKPIELECITTNQFPAFADITAAIEGQLERVHVRLRIVALPMAELSQRLGTGDFELFTSPTLTGYGILGPYLFWHSGQALPAGNYSAADAALDALRGAGSDDALRAGVREVLDVMHRDPPAAFVMALPSLRAVSRKWRVPPDEPDIRRTIGYWTRAEAAPCVTSR
jgi:peptide/nickel transport system substrate-binding protein